jgi:glycosyltransferase involved in cell wall biosynthesis
MSGLRIGVNALYLIPGGVGGSEIYLRSLLRAFADLDSPHRFVVYSNRETGAHLAPASPRFEMKPCAVRAAVRPARILYEQFVLPRRAIQDRLDVLFNPGFTAPAWAPCPQVTVFFDLQHKRHPEYFRWFDKPFWDLFLWISARVSQRLIAISSATAADLGRFYGVRAERLATVWLGVDERFFSLGGSLEEEPVKTLLCASTTHPHKNHLRLLRVFARFHERHPDWRLVLTGVRGFADREVQQEIGRLGLRAPVSVAGWVEREKLYGMFRSAAAFVYPSMFEGFGLPVLEAMASGLPVACSDIPPLREISGGAAVLFDPRDEESMLAALEKIASLPESRTLAQAGRARAREFSWMETARRTLEVLAGAAGAHLK